jgi:hypothetical protein
MSDGKKHRVCPVEQAGSLDTKIRRVFHNPRKYYTGISKTG